jgi:hypothetical protein
MNIINFKKVEAHEPKLIFFRKKPKNWLNLPPLGSSLQNLETSFILVSLNRYPHALISCFAAIESALKAFLKIKPNQRPYLYFEDLLNKAKQKVGSFNVNDSSLKDLREKRNDIIHYGFSPQDDKKSVELLLDTGYLFIEDCYEKFFNFSLTGQNGGLIVDLAYHYNVAKKIREKSKNKREHSSESCFVSLSHYIRWVVKDWFLSESDSSFLYKNAEEYNQQIEDFQNELKEQYDYKIFSSTWHFDCPICICRNDDSFICELDENELKNHREISFQRAYCVNCGFAVPNNCLYMTDELCKEQIDQQKEKILSEYGFSK